MSEHDTSYFDAEFTNEAVRLTPPQSSQRLETLEEMDEIQNNFTQFSFHHEVGIYDQNYWGVGIYDQVLMIRT